ncbi:hypothetical protein BS50DRAFT_664867 [Corynespora cassiicola Philippines]|uniref:F-box domain-containing protein n=1 Tax=Corynespora cassiicola Philippines TaxID=1448308 RepID=A0A2T2NR57_CORCC|nr:hypothetical protein BS50DRAFT_664867 [Corynespora cassiicola Philippines]
MLLDLSAEILTTIIEQLTDRADLKHLGEVSKYLYTITTPILYRVVRMEAGCEISTGNLSPKYIQHAREITFAPHTCARNKYCYTQSKFHGQVNRRTCRHGGYETLHSPQTIAEILSILEGCKENILQSFTYVSVTLDIEQRADGSSWAWADDIPCRLFGPAGYLTLKQRQIECMSLSTTKNIDIYLQIFAHLKKLSWRGPISGSQMEALGTTLQQISAQLVELKLENASGQRVLPESDTTWPTGVYLSEIPSVYSVLGLSIDKILVFQSLQLLSFTALSFKPETLAIVQALATASLRSLTIRFCTGWEEFLQQLCPPKTLKALEIQYAVAQETAISENMIAGFLERFKGLEELSLLTSVSGDVVRLWRAASHHKETLKRFVHHQRTIDAEEEECDVPNMTLLPRDVAMMKNLALNPFDGFNLECIGLCCDPRFLPLIESTSTLVYRKSYPAYLTHFDRYSNWGIQLRPQEDSLDSAYFDGIDGHNHSTCSEYQRKPLELSTGLRDLARWAFCPSGFPLLEMIVFGDFSCSGRYLLDSVLICRSNKIKSPYGPSELTESFFCLPGYHHRSQTLLEQFSKFLKACPANNAYIYH